APGILRTQHPSGDHAGRRDTGRLHPCLRQGDVLPRVFLDGLVRPLRRPDDHGIGLYLVERARYLRSDSVFVLAPIELASAGEDIRGRRRWQMRIDVLQAQTRDPAAGIDRPFRKVDLGIPPGRMLADQGEGEYEEESCKV